jgi:DNA-binding NarL/FixJ family response regulator
MTSGARRIPDSMLECYLAEALEPEAKARLEALLAKSPEDRARLEELRKDSLEFSQKHPSELLLTRVHEEWEHSFSESERAFLERLAPLMKGLVRNWRLQDEAGERAQVLDWLLRYQGFECVVLSSSGTELQRTEGATALLVNWFTPEERNTLEIPTALLERLELLISGRPHAGVEPSYTWLREGLEKSLQVRFVPLHERNGQRLWGMVFQEVANWAIVPASWRELLSQRELQVAECVLRGWDNQLIKEHLKCSLGTVKKHLQRVLDKLGVDSRAALIHKATRGTPSSGDESTARILRNAVGEVPMPAGPREKLTLIHVEVLIAVLRGWDTQHIAEHLGSSIGDVQAHLQAISTVLGVADVVALRKVAGAFLQAANPGSGHTGKN